MFEAVIFDWDGTLADTMPVIVLSFQKVLQEIGCRVSDEFLVKRIGIGARNIFKEALKSNGITFNEKTIDTLLRKKTRIHAELSGSVNLFDGAVELLDSLRFKVKLALATMSNREVIDKLLVEKKLENYFDFVTTVDEVKNPKPNPEAFLKCALKLNVPPEKCVVVEDSIFGVRAAKKANMKCIAVPSGAYSKEDLMKERPNLIVNSLNERRRILDYVLGGASMP
ncbi:hypothetical protein B6U79_00705 [Candidatus Bathyarchaeota archaeon ex4484_231]|nr:MAG: hypothetical protein B6U79_00705 [Candidatus Bathyarchaeota archaeon ex4484_231]RJS75050.1 MAG: HAD family phosphatase [Candidatus Bathyarchaeota archaeon]